MRPRIWAHMVTMHGTLQEPKPVINMGWNVDWWTQGGAKVVTHFWTWSAALDFANERVLDFRKINHLHLWS